VRIRLLSSGIGRGHPFYLRGLQESLQKELREGSPGSRGPRATPPGGGPADGTAGVVLEARTVFEVASGVSRVAWQAVAGAYRLAGRGGPLHHLYARGRGQAGSPASRRLLGLLGRDLRRWAAGEGPLVVDHPVLARAFEARDETWYMHGELEVPDEAIVGSAYRVFVPTEEAARSYARTGFPAERILVTGLCVEAGLVEQAETAFEARRERLSASGPLTLAFFSSGAEPPAHVRALVAAARAAVRGGHRCLVFALDRGRLHRAFVRARIPAGSAELVPFGDLEDLDRATAIRFARFDVVVSPPHERSNWALGLGLPFLLVGPDIGPFAPRNRALLLRSGVATEIDSVDGASAVSDRLAELRRTGTLVQMSARGFGRPRDGFARAARHLLDSLRA
jgi:hypothetical protein